MESEHESCLMIAVPLTGTLSSQIVTVSHRRPCSPSQGGSMGEGVAGMAEAALTGTMEWHLRDQGKVYVVLMGPSKVEDN